MVRYSIVVVESPEYFQAIEDALPREMVVLSWNIGFRLSVEVSSAFA